MKQSMTQSMGKLTSVIFVLCWFDFSSAVCVPIASAEEVGSQQTKPKKPSKSADDELTNELERELSDNKDSDETPFVEAVRSMRDVQKRIASSDTGESTRELQQKISKKLDDLIKRFKQQNQSMQQPNQNEDQPSDNNQKQPDQANQKSKPAQKLPSSNQQKDKNDAKDSTNRTDQAEQRQANLIELNRRSMIEEIWGHLPESLRKRILNIDSEQSLPKYAEHVRRYYETLAESEVSKSAK